MNILTQTPRLIIRLFKPEEETIYLSLYNDERVTQYLPYRSTEDLIKIFQEFLIEGPPEAVTGRWGIFNSTDDDFIGLCLLRLFDDGSDSIELGYVLNYKYWGKGIASEMAAALLSHMRAVKPGTHFVAVTDLDNFPSQRVLEKAGMKRDGNYFRHGVRLAFFRF